MTIIENKKGLGFNWSLWDQIAGSVTSINGHRMPLTSPSVQYSLWCQPVRINPLHQATVPIYYGSYMAIFYGEKPHNKAEKAHYGSWQSNRKEPDVQIPKKKMCICLYVDDTEFIGNEC